MRFERSDLRASDALSATAGDGENGFTFHANPDGSGHFVVPGLTWARAASARLDSLLQQLPESAN